MKLPTSDEIKKHFPNIAEFVLKNTLAVSEGIFTSRTTNLNIVKDKMGHILGNTETTLPESNYKLLTRYFLTSDPQKDAQGVLDAEKKALIKGLLCMSFCLMGAKAKPLYLTLDGTSWELGTKKIHILTLCVVLNGVSIPIWWQDLDKKGISSQDERIKFIKEALKHYNLSGMTLLADREYCGDTWFTFLRSQGIHFIIRLKEDAYRSIIDQFRNIDPVTTETKKHQRLAYSALQKQAYLPRYKNTGVAKFIEIEGNRYLFVIFRNPNSQNSDDELIYFLSSRTKKMMVIKAYPIRWSIECCFKHLKSNGFNLEAINFKNSLKIELMMAILVFLYVLCIRQGLIAYKKSKKSHYKQFVENNEKYKTLAVSIFRKGMAYLENLFYNLKSFIRFLNPICKKSQIPEFITHVQ